MRVVAKELWHNSYIKGRPTSCVSSIQTLGRAHLETAKLFNAGCYPDYKDTPSYKMFMSDNYGKLYGMENADNFLKGYIKQFQENFESIKANGYNSEISKISVDIINGEPYLIDGNRRIASVVAIGQEKEIEVMEGEPRFEEENVRNYLHYLAPQSPFIIGGKHILYQPTLGFEDNNHQTRTMKFFDLRDRIIKEIDTVEDKLILDIGSCFGFFSFSLSKLGAYTIGVETDGKRVNACRLISGYRKLDWSNPKFIHGHASEYIKESNLYFDITLMINVFHCLYREDPEMAWETMNIIAEKSGKVILCMDHGGIVNSQKNIVEFILSNSILNRAKLLGQVYSNRNLYLLEREI